MRPARTERHVRAGIQPVRLRRIAPRGLFYGVQIYFFLHLPQNPRTDFNGF